MKRKFTTVLYLLVPGIGWHAGVLKMKFGISFVEFEMIMFAFGLMSVDSRISSFVKCEKIISITSMEIFLKEFIPKIYNHTLKLQFMRLDICKYFNLLFSKFYEKAIKRFFVRILDNFCLIIERRTPPWGTESNKILIILFNATLGPRCEMKTRMKTEKYFEKGEFWSLF